MRFVAVVEELAMRLSDLGSSMFEEEEDDRARDARIKSRVTKDYPASFGLTAVQI